MHEKKINQNYIETHKLIALRALCLSEKIQQAILEKITDSSKGHLVQKFGI